MPQLLNDGVDFLTEFEVGDNPVIDNDWLDDAEGECTQWPYFDTRTDCPGCRCLPSGDAVDQIPVAVWLMDAQDVDPIWRMDIKMGDQVFLTELFEEWPRQLEQG